MLELTTDTKRVAEALFSSEDAERMKERLRTETADKSAFHAFNTAESRERIWLAIIKMCKETLDPWDEWFDLAKSDWRDLLMAADFGRDTKAHVKWKQKVLTKR
jgi:hypothetical protein